MPTIDEPPTDRRPMSEAMEPQDVDRGRAKAKKVPHEGHVAEPAAGVGRERVRSKTGDFQ